MRLNAQTNVTFFTNNFDRFSLLRQQLREKKGVVVVDCGDSPLSLASEAVELALISSVIPTEEGGVAQEGADLVFVEAFDPTSIRQDIQDELKMIESNEIIQCIAAAYKQEGYSVKITRAPM